MNKYAQFSKASKARKDIYKKAHNPKAKYCIKKMKFDTKGKAESFLGKGGYKGKAYFCKYCNFWHNTSKAK